MSKFAFNSRVNKAGTVVSINEPIPDFGGLFVNDTAEHGVTSPQFFTHFLCLTDAVIDIATSNIDGTVTAVTVKAGTKIPFNGQRVKLASGTGIAYYGESR